VNKKVKMDRTDIQSKEERINEYINSVRCVRPETYESDPRRADAEMYFQENKSEILDEIINNREFFEKNLEQTSFPLRIEKDGIIITVFLVRLRCESESMLVMYIAGKEYAKSTAEYASEIFPKESDRLYGRKISEIANTLGTEPTDDFTLTKEIDSNITDSLGRGLDSRISELVRILNNIGISTDSSCGGHQDKNLQPYVMVQMGSLKKLIEILQSFEKEIGKKSSFVINPLFAGGIPSLASLHNGDDITVQASQAEFDKLLKFLIERTGGIPFKKMSTPEVVNRIRLKVSKILGH